MPDRPWLADPEYQAWATRIHDHVLPGLESSGAHCMFFAGGLEPDINYAVELGLSVLLDKPILVVRPPGMEIPERLRRVADLVVEIDLAQPGVGEHLGQLIKEFVDGLDEEATNSG